MKQAAINLIVFLVAILAVSYASLSWFTVWENWWLSESFIRLGSFYAEKLFMFLFLSLPYIVGGFILTKAFTGKYRLIWCWVVCAKVLLTPPWLYVWFPVDGGFMHILLSNAAQYLPPLTLGLTSSFVLWAFGNRQPNPSFKRDTLKRAP